MQVLFEKPIKVELEGTRVFVNNEPHRMSVRKLSELRGVLRGYVIPEATGDPDIYYMFRNVYEKDGIRFDITIIPPRVIEGECAKTYGHNHPPAEEGLSYPEVYQVLGGTAVFLLQQANRDRSVNVSLIRAMAGDVVLIPANMAHVTINPGGDTLVLANIVADGFESDYSDFRKNRGAAFYYLPDGNIEQNANYIVRDLERPMPQQFNRRYGFACGSLLEELERDPRKFAFLKKPSLLFRRQ